MQVNSWKKELPIKSGYYWAILKQEGFNVIVPLVVGDVGLNGKEELACSLGTSEPRLLNEIKEEVLFWNGPFEAPELTDEIKQLVGELQEI